MNSIVLALFSATCTAIAVIFAKLGMRNTDSNVLVFWSSLLTVVLSVGSLAYKNHYTGTAYTSSTHWLYIALSSVFGALATVIYFKALEFGDASQVVPVDRLSVAIIAFLSLVFLGEKLSVGTVIGGILVTLGVSAILWIKA